MKFNRLHVQIALEALIPILGFFFWNWSLYFILLFYLLDVLSDEWILHLKSKKIDTYQPGGKRTWLKYSLISILLLLASIAGIHLIMRVIHPSIEFINEIIAFWKYEEMGIQQGYLFVPLVFLLGYQQYKMEFLLPARYRQITINEVWQSRIRDFIVLLSCLLVTLSIAYFISISELIYVAGIVVFTSVYKLFLR